MLLSFAATSLALAAGATAATPAIDCFFSNLFSERYAPFKSPIAGKSSGGRPDKIFEEAAFLERFRNTLVMENGGNPWLAPGTPRLCLEQGRKISVKNAPTHFETTSYEIVSDVDNGKINAAVEMPARDSPDTVLLRLRHPSAAPIRRVTVNGRDWSGFNKDKETTELKGLAGTAAATAYC